MRPDRSSNCARSLSLKQPARHSHRNPDDRPLVQSCGSLSPSNSSQSASHGRQNLLCTVFILVALQSLPLSSSSRRATVARAISVPCLIQSCCSTEDVPEARTLHVALSSRRAATRQPRSPEPSLHRISISRAAIALSLRAASTPRSPEPPLRRVSNSVVVLQSLSLLVELQARH